MLRGIEPQVADHLAAAGKALDLSQRHSHGPADNRTYSRMRLQQLRDRIFLCLLLGRNIQVRDAAIQIVQQLQRILAPSRRPAGQRQLLQQLPSGGAPQLALPLRDQREKSE